jgi:hypothetical protein
MIGRIPLRSGRLVASLLATMAVMAVAASAASAMTIYQNFPEPAPGNLPSLGFEATSTSEFGGEVEFGRKKRNVKSVSVEMSSWACQEGANTTCTTHGSTKFQQPITLKIYEVGAGNEPGALLDEQTSTFKIHYRPSENPACPITGEGNKGWGPECFSGFLQKITFKLSPQITVGQTAIIAIAYNTENYGAHPTGVAGPYNSLNVAVSEVAPSIGSDPLPADAYLDSTWGGAYCNEAEGVGYFRLDPGCWTGYQPSFQIKA